MLQPVGQDFFQELLFLAQCVLPTAFKIKKIHGLGDAGSGFLPRVLPKGQGMKINRNIGIRCIVKSRRPVLSSQNLGQTSLQGVGQSLYIGRCHQGGF